MSFDTEKAKLSRTPFLVVKFELDTTISPGGAEYHCSGRAPLGQLFYESIKEKGFDPTPTKMSVGSGVGFLGSVKIQLKDFKFGENGTYWGKLLANNPYYLDRKLKVFTGFYDGQSFDWDNFQEKLYFIKKINGPDSDGNVTVIASDPLTLLDKDQAQTPTTPNAKLASSITATQEGTVDITDNTGFDAAGGTADFDGEFVTYSGTSGADSIVIASGGRGAFGSEAKEHDADDPVSPCYSYTTENVVDVIRDLIEKFSPIDHASYIPDTDWDFQRDNFLVGATATGVYPAGTPIKDEIDSLSEQFRLSVFWDDEDQEIKLVPIGPLVSAAKRINVNEHILKDQEDVIRDPTKAVSETWVYYGRINHADDETDPNNYEHWYIVPNAAATTGLGKAKVKKIFAKNIPAAGSSSANNLADRINSQLSEGLITYKFQLDIKDADVKVGQVVEVYTPLIQGTDGLPVPTSFVIIERDPIKGTLYRYKAVRTGFALGSNYRRIAPDTLDGLTYTSATDEQKATYLFIADIDEEFSDDDPGHWIY